MGMKLSLNTATGMGWDGKGTEVLGIGANGNTNYSRARLYSVVVVLQDSSEQLDTVLVVRGKHGNEN